MTSVQLHPPSKHSRGSSRLPQLLQTPSGLALLELQGTFNMPQDGEGEPMSGVEIGRLVFPDYVPDAEGSAWMKRAHLYVGQHQRLTGEVKKLPKALAIVRRKDAQEQAGSGEETSGQSQDLEVVEIVKYKLLFSNRPEPVGTENAP